ncbi:somatotropin-like [Mantella aurantiaca]
MSNPSEQRIDKAPIQHWRTVTSQYPNAVHTYATSHSILPALQLALLPEIFEECRQYQDNKDKSFDLSEADVPISLSISLSAGFGSTLVLLVIMCLQSPPGFSAFPQMSPSNLFTNAVIRAHYLHQMVADSYLDYELTYIPEDLKSANKQSLYCYSETIPAPTDKDNTHQKSDMDLLRFSLILLQSWMNSVKVFRNHSPFRNIDKIYDRLKDLNEGVLVLIREVDDGNVRNYNLQTFTYDTLDVNLRSEESRVKNYRLLSCLKKDMHKVETYLKVIKCRRFVESNCTF